MTTSSSDGASAEDAEFKHHQSYVDVDEGEFRAVTGFFDGVLGS